MKYFMTDNQVIHEEEKLQDGVWVRMISPTQEECEEIAADSGGRSDDRDPAR